MTSAFEGKIQVELGPVEFFEAVPVSVEVDGKRFFMGRRGDQFVLLSSLCPHRGGPVLSTGDHLECPLHEWKFDPCTGEALDCEGDGLESFEVESDGGILRAILPRQAVEQAHPTRAMPSGDTKADSFEIDATSTVGDVLDRLGEPAVDLFHQFGFACLGCALADEESIRRAALRHGLSTAERQDLVEQLRAIRDA